MLRTLSNFGEGSNRLALDNLPTTHRGLVRNRIPGELYLEWNPGKLELGRSPVSDQPILFRPLFWAVCSLIVVTMFSIDALRGGVWLNQLTSFSSESDSAAIHQVVDGVTDKADDRRNVFQLPNANTEAKSNVFRKTKHDATALPVVRQLDQSTSATDNSNPSIPPASTSGMIPQDQGANESSQPVSTRDQEPSELSVDQVQQIFDPDESTAIKSNLNQTPAILASTVSTNSEITTRIPALQVPIGYFQYQPTDEPEISALDPEMDTPNPPLSHLNDLSKQNSDEVSSFSNDAVEPTVPGEQPAFEFASPLPTTEEPSQDVLTDQNSELTKAEPLLVPDSRIAKPIAVSNNDRHASVDENANDSDATAWPRPVYLLNCVSETANMPSTRNWSGQTIAQLEKLASVPTLDSPDVDSILMQLEHQTAALGPLTIAASITPAKSADDAEGPAAAQLRRLGYSLRQQIDIWRYAHRLAGEIVQTSSAADPQAVVKFLSVSYRRLSLPGVSSNWREYLLLDELNSTFNTLNSDTRQQRSMARRFLSRLSSPILDATQRQFLSENIDSELIEQLKTAAREPVQIQALLADIEYLQQSRSGVAQYRVNQHYQNLLWHDDDATQELADGLDMHFRNANFRMSVSDELLNLLLPQQTEAAEPVNENIMGAQVSGHSRIANRLQLRLVPDNSRIHMRLEAFGLVRSDTEAYRSGFTVQNVGDARFQVFKKLMIGRDGIEADGPQATSNSNNKMVGMRSNLDGIPIVGWIARRIAQKQIAQQSPQVERFTQNKLETTVKSRFDYEIDGQLSQLQNYLYTNLIEPLTSLELEPTPLEMRSTDSRVIMRYRLSGRDQMAGNTSRPRGQQSSLLSMQIHESTINNLLNRIDLNGREFTSAELTQHLADVFGSQQVSSVDETDATLEFAPFDPIRVTMEDKIIAIQLNLKRLKIGGSKTWKNLTVTCNFIPQTDGNRILLVQDGAGVELTGHRLGLRDQVAVRTIFTALFKDQYEMAVLPATLSQKIGQPLVVSQLDVTDGWIGLSLDKAGQPSMRQTSQQTPAIR